MSAGIHNPVPGDKPETTEELLSGKLTEQADAVTAQLRDLIPEPPAVEPTMVAVADSTVSAGPADQGVAALPSAAPAGEAPDAAIPLIAASVNETPHDAPADTAIISVAVQRDEGPMPPIESSSDDRLMSALAWLTLVLLQLPIVSVIQLLSPGTKDRTFQRHHAVTSLLFFAAAIIYELVAGIVYAILGALTLGCGYACLWFIFFLPHALGLYYALKAYNGKLIELPGLSNFGRQQGWL